MIRSEMGVNVVFSARARQTGRNGNKLGRISPELSAGKAFVLVKMIWHRITAELELKYAGVDCRLMG